MTPEEEEYRAAQEQDLTLKLYVLKIRRVLNSLKPHRCTKCGKLYLAGSSLQYRVFVFLGEFFHGYTCSGCQGGESGGDGWS
jgi:hypothetical protein